MEKINVLVVDDEEINLDLLEEIIRDDDVKVYKAKSGVEALKISTKREYAAIIIDVNMPLMDGYDLAKLLKKESKVKDIPIIFITALQTKTNTYKAYKTGAIDFITKPLDPIVIKSKVDIFIEVFKSKKYLEQVSKSKTNFLANMSHEIRTPLNSILGMTQVMSEGDLNSDQEKYINIIQRAGKDLLSLINNILDLSKIESGELKLDKEEFFIDDIFNNSIDLLQMSARKKGIEVYCDIKNSVPDFFHGDPTRLKQILINLITNAIKYTEEGYVKVSGELIEDSDIGPDTLVITISDTGRGIPEEKKQSLFKSFFQVNPLMDKKKGFGLGLAITKNLVQLMKGKLDIESEVNKGSKFIVKLPAQTSNKNVFKANILKDKSVLVINLKKELFEITKSIFDNMSAKVTFQNDLEKAKEEIKENSKNHQMIFFFWNFKEDDSFEINDIYGNDKELIKKTVFLVQSSIKFKKPPGRFIYTPLKRSELKRHTSQLMISQAHPDEKKSLKPDIEEKKEISGNILLVDDSEDSRLLIKIFLKKTNINIDTAVNGVEGLEQFKKKDYDLILMDVQMPEMDGLKCTEEIRKYEAKNPEKNKVPILAMTAYAFNEDVQKTKNAGCNDHISKPINKGNLVKSITKLLIS